ncbi:NADPH2:quinone reductase [Nonomuraea jiangxiensis]|uniref:NADPH2:quinone reductase n=1 Tax=Nonomuraea jiangxiensis TaxID=633440 RepID=A0A1G9URB2_9ACTN|nr:NADPH2:quinone reductase [Nonomuraea jiangxiensis]
MVIDPVGGQIRTQSLALMPPGGRLIAAGNASGDWDHTINDTQLWLGSVTIAGFNAGAFLPTHPDLMQPALHAARTAIAAGLGDTAVETLPLSHAAHAHQRMEDRDVAGRLALAAQA